MTHLTPRRGEVGRVDVTLVCIQNLWALFMRMMTHDVQPCEPDAGGTKSSLCFEGQEKATATQQRQTTAQVA